MAKKISIIVILVIIIVGVWAFGHMVSQKKAQQVATNQTPATQDQSNVQPLNTTANSGTPTSSGVSITSLLAANPGANATQDQLKAYSMQVSAAASDAATLDITGCSPKPNVIHLKLKRPFTLKNSDTVDHKLVNGSIIIDAPASSENDVTPAFTSPGIYGYSCDTKLNGIFFVTP